MILRSVIVVFLVLTWMEIKDMNSKMFNYKALYEKTGLQVGCSLHVR